MATKKTSTNKQWGLARRWRPQSFDEVVGQDHISQSLKRAIRNSELRSAYLFAGPRGVGKTTTARILAKSLNCLEGPTIEPCGKCSECRSIALSSNMDVMEIDGATYTGIDSIRELQESIAHLPYAARKKVYIIDEVHMLSISAFNALLKTLEEPPSFVIFVFATTEPEKIPPTVRSRCQEYVFKPLETQDIILRLQEVVTAEEITLEKGQKEQILQTIALHAEGSMRDALVSLEQLSILGEGTITIEHLYELLGAADTELLHRTVQHLAQRNSAELLNIVSQLAESGRNLERFVKNLIKFVRDLLVRKAGGDTASLSFASSQSQELTEQLGFPFLLNTLHQLFDLEEAMKTTTYPRFLMEFTFVKLSALQPTLELDKIIAHLQTSAPQRHPSPPPPEIREPAPEYSAQEAEAKKEKELDLFSGPAEAAEEEVAGEGRTLGPQEFWQKFLTVLRRQKLTLAKYLSDDCQFVSFSNNELIVGIPSGQNYVCKFVERNNEFLTQLASRLAGRKIKITCIELTPPAEASVPQEPAEAAPEPQAEPAAENGEKEQLEETPEMTEEIEEIKETPRRKLSLKTALRQDPELKKALNLITDLFHGQITKFNQQPITAEEDSK